MCLCARVLLFRFITLSIDFIFIFPKQNAQREKPTAIPVWMLKWMNLRWTLEVLGLESENKAEVESLKRKRKKEREQNPVDGKCFDRNTSLSIFNLMLWKCTQNNKKRVALESYTHTLSQPFIHKTWATNSVRALSRLNLINQIIWFGVWGRWWFESRSKRFQEAFKRITINNCKSTAYVWWTV